LVLSGICPLPLLGFPTWRVTTLPISLATRKHYGVGYDLFEEFTVGKKLYVGNLSYNVTNEALEELFAPFGTVTSAQVIQDRDTGRSKGFGFVEMGDDNALARRSRACTRRSTMVVL